MKNWINYIAIVLLINISSCDKKGEAEDFYYEYFPTEIGAYVIYDIDETIYDLQTTSEQYQIKELIESEFTDNLGRKSLRIERYKRSTWPFHAGYAARGFAATDDRHGGRWHQC